LDIEYWNLFGPILRSGGACDLEFKPLVLVICYFRFIRDGLLEIIFVHFVAKEFHWAIFPNFN
jgi:hypothetical protein